MGRLITMLVLLFTVASPWGVAGGEMAGPSNPLWTQNLPRSGDPSAPSNVPPAVERYAHAMELVAKSSGPVSLEGVFEEGMSASDALVRGELERLDEPTYQKVRGMMVGFMLGREEVIVAAPVTDYFLKLAREKGTAADRAFFEALKKTYPENAWPIYTRPQTDYSGCTVLDGKTLTEVYGTWIAFRDAYPQQYRRATQKELEEVDTAFGSTCACDGEEGVRQELETFLNAYPTSPLASTVAARLEAVKKHTSGIRFSCQSG